ncbi:MAG: ABC transporter permease [Actinomycetota bacterium]|nr:ABC transporter permease [Actinomycetota bacterium]
MRRSGDQRNITIGVAVFTVVSIVAVQLLWFPLQPGMWVRGVVLGLLTAMLAVGMALIYRANRVINFAQADLGTVPMSFAVSFILLWHWPYLVGLGAGLAIAIVLGLVVEMAFIRRFRNSPRMVMTVATLGVAQLLVAAGILVPRWWGKNLVSQRPAAPVDWKLTVSASWPPWKPDARQLILGGNDIIAMIVAPCALLFVAWFLNRSRLGTAIRASAERSDRAAMLGIPVARLNTVVWMLAAALSYLALFMRTGITGVPLGFAEGLPTLLIALAALVIGRLEHLGIITAAAVALKLLEFAVQGNSRSAAAAYPIMAAAMFVALLAQRNSASRRDVDATSSWRGAEEVRRLPSHLAAHPWVSTIRYTLIAAVVMGTLLLPQLVEIDTVSKASAVVAFAVIGLSVVVLTGWAGQVSLGQMGIVGIGAAVGATCTSRWHVDLTLALLVGGLAGAAAAFAVGVPALRLRGLYLAVTTFALALATEYWLLNDVYFGWFPKAERGFDRPPLFGRISVASPTAFYFYSVVVLVLMFGALRGIRRSRTGRVILAIRENERAAQSFSVGLVRAKLTAFVISGFTAGVGGVLYTHSIGAFSVNSFTVGESFNVFTSAVIGGLGSLGGALLGALYLRGTRWFITDQTWQLLSTGLGVLVVLLVLPGGIGGLWVKVRDAVVRLVTGQRVDDPAPTVDDLARPSPAGSVGVRGVVDATAAGGGE